MRGTGEHGWCETEQGLVYLAESMVVWWRTMSDSVAQAMVPWE